MPTIYISLSPGGEVTGTNGVAANSGTGIATVGPLYIESAGTVYLLATALNADPDESSSSYTITNTLSKIEMVPDSTSVATSGTFSVSVTLVAEDGTDYATPCSLTITEDQSSAISGTSSGTITGTGTIGTMSFATAGVKVLVTTCGSVTGTASITVTGTDTATLTYTGDLIINHLITFTSALYDVTGHLVTTSSNAGSLSGTAVTQVSTTSPTSTGLITYTAILTATGSQTVYVTHGGATGSITITIDSNTAKITPSQDWGYVSSTLTYTVSLEYEPYNSETISISYTATQFSLTSSSLVFTSGTYSTAQTQTVTILSSTSTGEWTSTISHTNSDMTFSSCSGQISSAGVFTVTIYSASTRYILISALPVMIEGSSGTYSLSVSTTPSTSVTIAITGDSSLSFSPSTVTFTSTTATTITVTSSVSSSNGAGANALPIYHTVTSATDSNYLSAVMVPSSVYAYVIKETSPSVLISEDVVFQEYLGGEYFVLLTSPPTSSVTVSLSTTGTTIAFSPSSLTFTSTNYYIPQTVTLSSVSGTTALSYKYSITIVHTVTSSDGNYNGITPMPSGSITVTALNPCSAGEYSWPPGSGTCEMCPLGYSCDTLFSEDTACSSTQFSPQGVWSCMVCPPGHSCSGTAMPQPCPDGQTSAWGTGACSACTGNSCDHNGIAVATPPAGFYIINNGHSFYQCPPGYKCTGGTAAPVACSSGYYAPIGSSTCTQCPAGYYCPDPATPIPLLCDPYSFSVAGSTQCTYCPVGYSCTTTAKTACASGYNSLEGWTYCLNCDLMCHGEGITACGLGQYMSGTTCTACPQGYECDGNLKKACPPGYYSAASAAACTACTTGTYSNTPLATSCTTVTSGYIANLPYIGQFPCYRGTMPNSLNNACISCTAGYQCDTPSTPTACVAGYFCSPIGLFESSANNQQACPSGYENASTGSSVITACTACTAGTYCPKASSAGINCPYGHYCPQYSYMPDNFPCPIGTYNNAVAQTSLGSCTTCPAGSYCYQGAYGGYPCFEGYYCPSGSNYPFWCSPGYTSVVGSIISTACTACAQGMYCPPGSYPLSCPAGTYNPNTALGFRWDACTTCTAGYSCSAIAQTVATTYACSSGSYCPAGTEFADQYPCPAGTYTDSTSLTSVSGCTACPAGSYCKIESTSAGQILCPRGYYCPLSTSYSHEYPCASGTFSWPLGNTVSTQCGACTAGYYCTPGASYLSGYCSPGSYCPASTILPDLNPCAAGTFMPYSNATASTDCQACPPGSYCLQGAPAPLPCPRGTYASSGSTTSYSSCTSCSAGTYCEAGSSSPTTCPDGYYSLANAYECYECPGGYYCASGVKTQCSLGNYCPEGSSASITCPAGYYCTVGVSEGTPCLAGTYVSSTGSTSSSACTQTTAGYYSIAGATAITGECEPGYYCIAGSAGPYNAPCAAGFYNTAPGGTASSSCSTCTAGYYCKLGTAFPTICPEGSYCVAGSSSPTYCPSGTVGVGTGLTASTDCTSCPEGSFCSQPGLLVADGNCVLGYYCDSGSSLSTGTSTCPAGGYCQPGFPSQRACPPGTYNPNTGAKDITSCGKCNAGYYCTGSETAANANPCTAGYYCAVASYWTMMAISGPGYYSLAAASSETYCAIGTFNNLYAQSACTTCTAGFYCPSTIMTQPTICPVGNYCASGVSIYSNCPVSTFSQRKGLTQSSDCVACTAGYYCLAAGQSTTSGLCDPGYYCTFGSTAKKPVDVSTSLTVAGQCPAGYFCPQGTPVSIACPTGTYLSTILGTSSSSCQPCTAGYYCTTTALTAVQGQCDPGYYCSMGSTLGTTVPRPTTTTVLNYCGLGQYCPTGSSETTDCDGGTYQDELRQSVCKTCPEGFYCAIENGDYSANICPQGYYCPAGTYLSNTYPCPIGTWSNTPGLTDSSQCLLCGPGYYCGSSGMTSLTTTCTDGYFCKLNSGLANSQVNFPGDSKGGMCIEGYYCPAGSVYGLDCDGGSYCNAKQLSAVVNSCSAGYYCIGAAYSSTPTDGTTGNLCPAGFYCPLGSISPIPCPIGTYNSAKGKTQSSDCTDCPAGKYCGGVGLSIYSGFCQAGFYCTGKNYELMPVLGQCPAGYYCPTGSSAQNACSSGQYQDQVQQSSCKNCPVGYYCPSSAMTSPTQCEAGYYCLINSSAHQPCPSGTYSIIAGLVSANGCTTCPPGKYCSGGQSAPDGDCTAGYYCLNGAVSPLPSEDAQGGKCPKGYYCPAGSTSAIKCTPGYYCATTGLTTPTGTCLEGYYCTEGASIQNPRDGSSGNICPAGYYCPQGSAYPTPCGIGYYQPYQEKIASTDCVICGAGFYCNSLAATSVTGLCYAGYSCPAGSTAGNPVATICPAANSCGLGSGSPTVCPDTYYQDQIGQSVCKTCPAGFYCDKGTTGVTTPTICPVGYICPAGTSSSSKIACEYGYFNPFLGQSSCQICPTGQYCGSGPLTAGTVCDIYSYCPEGTTFPEPNCAPGTYTDQNGLQTMNQCKQCIIGSYCTNGIVQGVCNAGYYCASGSDTPTPDSYTNAGKAGPCPVGHYCLAGTLLPTICPEGKFRVSTGGAAVTDCSYCEAGYYCIPNNPIPVVCPTGAYCPSGSSTPLLCPEGYYSTATQASSNSTCLICPAGYLCSRAGIGSYTNFPCTPGYYCPTGALLPLVAPQGFYSPGYFAGTVSDLVLCPGGFYCEQMATGYQMCSIGTYCPLGTYSPLSCPAGYFCDYQTTAPSTCPQGWYCQKYSVPMTDYPPLLCAEGAICPVSNTTISSGLSNYQGSIVPTVCSAGTYAIMSRDITTGYVSACIQCPAGAYSNASSTSCTACDAGYICLAGATEAEPTDVSLYNGYECTPGYYCPSGILAPIPCPEGTYSNVTMIGSLGQCLPCPLDTYSLISGATSCSPCGSSSASKLRSTTCTCLGAYRVYLQASSTCVCMKGYQYIDSRGTDISATDGTTDCTQTVYARCSTGQVRDELGNCRSSTDCAEACNGGPGVRPVSTGVCQCQDVSSVDAVCDETCRSSAVTYTYGTDGNIVEYDPTTGTSTTISPSSLPGYAGSMNCASSSGCTLVTVDYTSSFQGNYGASSSVSRRRRLQATPAVSNPVVCLNKGDSMAFAVSVPHHYPVYLINSLLNSNANFDYSAFTQLATDISKGAYIQVFAFTFTSAGVYLFADKTDTDQQIIVGVMESGSTCPFSGANIQPRMTASVHLIGAKLDSNIVLSIDWVVIYTIMGLLVLAIIIFSGIFYYYALLTWSLPPMEAVKYREENMRLNIKGDEGTRTTVKMVIDGKEASSSGSEAEEVRDMLFEKVSEKAQEEAPDDKQTIDGALMQAIKDKIRENNSLFLNYLDENEQDALERMKRLEMETAELRQLLKSLLDPVALKTVKNVGSFQKEITLAADSLVSASQTTNIEYQEALNEINNNSELLENDKQKLMNELNSELNKLDQNLRLEKSKHDEELNKRLQARALRKRELERKKQELEVEEKQVIKKQQNEVWEIAAVIEKEEIELNHEIADDKFDMARKIHGQKAVELQNRLREGLAINPDKQQELMREYESEMQGLEKNLNMNQIKQQQDLARRLEEKKRQRRAALKDKESKMQNEMESKHKLELEAIRKMKAEIEAQEVVASLMPVVAEASDEKELKELKNKQKEELFEAEKQIKELEEQEISKLLRNSSVVDTKLIQQKAALEKQKRELLQSVSTATEEEKEELMRYLADTDKNLKAITEQQGIENKKNLDARLDIRRQKREEKLRELKQKQEKEKQAAENVLKEKQKTEKASSLESAIREALSKLPEDQKDKAIQAMLEEKHENERIELQKKLKRKLRDRQKDSIQEVMRMKANDLELLRNEYRDKLKAAGRDSESSAQIQKEEAEALNKLDYFYMKKLETTQEEAWRDQQKRNQDELLALIDGQLAEMRKHMRKQDPGKQVLEEKLKKDRENIEAEGREKIELLERQKKELEELKAQKQKELEELIRNEQLREEKERRIKLVLEKKKSIMERQRREKEELLRRGQLTKEQMDRLIADHQKELDALESAIARERDRQIAIMSQKLAEKRSRKKEYEHSMLRMKEEQDKWQKELEELPGISNKQATTLLLKWRRYPKKGFKDIEKSLKTTEPNQRILPVVNKQEKITAKKVENSRLEELLWRIEKIESTVEHVDTSHVQSIMKSITGIEQKMRAMKK